jgi:hypothetical protein
LLLWDSRHKNKIKDKSNSSKMFALLFALLVACSSALHLRVSAPGGVVNFDTEWEAVDRTLAPGIARADPKAIKKGLGMALKVVKLENAGKMTSERKTEILNGNETVRKDAVDALRAAKKSDKDIKEIEGLLDQMKNELEPTPFYKKSWFFIIVLVVACLAGGLLYFFVVKE